MRGALILILLAACASSDEPSGGDTRYAPGDARNGDPSGGDPLASGDPGGGGDPGAAPGDPGEVSDFSLLGPYSTTTTSGSTTVNGCNLAYDLTVPDGQVNAPLVVLGHGFQRSKSNMIDLATHVASWGLRVATPDYCHSSLFDTDHLQNGLDAAALSAELASGAAVVHAGYSAGGASAFVAAANDTATVGVMGLDAVDSPGMATAAASLTVPVFGLAGASNSCNDDNNSLPAYAAAADGWAVRVVGAGHCDFEAPTGVLCTLSCGEADPDRQALVASMLAAFSAWVAGVDASGADWVEPTGATYGELVAAGTIAPL